MTTGALRFLSANLPVNADVKSSTEHIWQEVDAKEDFENLRWKVFVRSDLHAFGQRGKGLNVQGINRMNTIVSAEQHTAVA